MISKTFYQRGLQFLMPATQGAYVQVPNRAFAKKGKKGAASDAEEGAAEEASEEPVPEPVKKPVAPKVVPKAAAPKGGKQIRADFAASAVGVDAKDLNLPKSLFAPFTVGDVKKVQSTDDHKPPMAEDTIEGRYAGVLFTAASQNKALFEVFEDMRYLSELYATSESFRLFTENGGIGGREIRLLNAALRETAEFNDTTMRFLEVLAENKRLVYIKEIAQKFGKLYQVLNKEEKITIISAEKLNDSQQKEVLEALKANPLNEGKEFIIEYEVDASIRGGLQMYTESEFMDMSLASRLDRINVEVSKLAM